MEIRELGPDDGLAYRAVRLRALELAPMAFASTVTEESAHPEAFWTEMAERIAASMESTIFALDRGEAVLGGTAFVSVSPEPPHEAYVGAMWVDSDLRGAGWADALLEAAERFASQLGAELLTLWVSSENELARRFYERHGYRSTGVSEPQSSGILAELLEKPLSAAGL